MSNQLPEDLAIREATKADVAAIHAIEEASFPAPWRAEFFGHEIGEPSRLNLVAVRGRTVVGYMFGMWVLDEMHVNKIAVAAHERRKGIAEALMARTIEYARNIGIADITLEVRESNEPARVFYERIGFASVYRRPRYYPDGEAAVIMTYPIPGSTLP